jgi:hypothetical protein
MRIAEKDTFIHYALLAIVCGLIMVTTSGCALMDQNGLGEFHLTVGHRSVTKREVKEETYRTGKPIICYVMPSRCPQAEPAATADEANGS